MEKKEIKISVSTLIILVIALILLVAVVIMGIHIANQNKALEEVKKSQQEQVANESKEDKTSSENANNTTITELSIDSELVKKLYENIYDSGIINGYYCSMYEEKKTNDMYTDDEKFLMAIDKILSADYLEYSSNYSILEEEISFEYEENKVKDKIYEMFGSTYNKVYNDNDIEYKNGKYNVTFVGGSSDGEGEWSVRKIIKAEMVNNDTINIYDNYIFTYGYDNEPWFATSDRKIPLPVIKYLDDSGNYVNDYIDWNQETHEYDFTANHVLPIYKHTFKKGNNGTYYWESTELTNKNELKTI